jgi:hypothetical protein
MRLGRDSISKMAFSFNNIEDIASIMRKSHINAVICNRVELVV